MLISDSFLYVPIPFYFHEGLFVLIDYLFSLAEKPFPTSGGFLPCGSSWPEPLS
jgi:hypothetical protein